VIPLKDENPTRRAPIVTVLLIVACIGIFWQVQPTGQLGLVERDPREELRFTVQNAAIPCEVVEGRPLSIEEIEATFGQGDATACQREGSSGRAAFPSKNVFFAVLVSMFLHGSWMHLLGNMLFLWIFGNNIEDTWHHAPYAVFYVLAGLAATMAHILVQPSSTVPVVGASGAIAGVMGAYLVLFPLAKIKTLIFIAFFLLFRSVPAWLLLGFWFVSQFFINPNAGVAWMAHVGGFVFGAVAALVYKAFRRPEPAASYSRYPFSI
jgi:membrane associated rhomboid family serine protease